MAHRIAGIAAQFGPTGICCRRRQTEGKRLRRRVHFDLALGRQHRNTLTEDRSAGLEPFLNRLQPLEANALAMRSPAAKFLNVFILFLLGLWSECRARISAEAPRNLDGAVRIDSGALLSLAIVAKS